MTALRSCGADFAGDAEDWLKRSWSWFGHAAVAAVVCRLGVASGEAGLEWRALQRVAAEVSSCGRRRLGRRPGRHHAVLGGTEVVCPRHSLYAKTVQAVSGFNL